MRRFAPLTALLLLALAVSRTRADSETNQRAYLQAARAAGWIHSSGGSGTGWVVDRASRLMVTNQHVVVDDDTVTVIFPIFRGGEPVADQGAYRNAPRVKARVIHLSVEDDLALIQLDSLPPGTVELKLAAASPKSGAVVHSVGNPGSSDALWVYTNGTVRSVYHKTWLSHTPPVTFNRRSTRVVETQSPTNPGDSGGPLVNDRGELVGVTQGGDAPHLMSWFIDVNVVRDFVAAGRRILNPTSAEDYTLRGVSLYNRGRYVAAARDLTVALRLDPGHAPALSNRALVHLEKGDLESALADGTRAVELRPGDAFAHFVRARTLMRRKDYDGAIAGYTQALQLRPGYAAAYNGRGTAHSWKDDWASAAADYNEAVRADPDHPEYVYNRGWAYAQQGNHKQAVADYNAAVQRGGPSAELLNHRGKSLAKLGQGPEAFKDFLAAAELAPKWADPLANAGRLLLRDAKDYPKAAALLTEALQRDPKSAVAHFLRGEAFEEMQDATRAHADYEAAGRLDADYLKLTPLRHAKYLQVANTTSEVLEVYVQYYTRTTAGEWKWFPSGGKPLVFRVRPGATASLFDGDWKINANRVRIWAVGTSSRLTWNTYRNQDLYLAREPYRSQEMAAMTYTFRP